MIRFNVPPYVGKETEYMKEAIDSHKICGDGVLPVWHRMSGV